MKRLKATGARIGFLLAVVSAALMTGTMPIVDANNNNNDFDLDHFRCYSTSRGQPARASVTLKDQFNEHKNVTIFASFAFCNPTQKTHNGKETPIQNPNGHLTVHPAAPVTPPPLQVLVANQFGPQTLTLLPGRDLQTQTPIPEYNGEVGRSVGFLLTPTQKLPHGKPRGLDHFLCYPAEGTPVGKSVDLKDQFGTETAVPVLNPIFFCNPVKKKHNQKTTGIGNPEDHLTVYSTAPPDTNGDSAPLGGGPRTVTVQNQFGSSKLTIGRAIWLAVPSDKCEPQNDLDNDGLIDANETLFQTLLSVADSDGDGIKDGNDDANGNGIADEDEDDNDACPDADNNGNGIDDEDEDD